MVTDFAAQATIALEATRRERQLRELQTALAHVNRVTTMGQLAASIAHELKQPLAAMMINGNTSLRWLAKDPPELDEVRQSVELMIKDGNRAAAVIERIHGLVKKSAPRTDAVDINDAIREVISLIHNEATKDSVVIKTQLTKNMAHIRGDRVQLQQVILNLIVNAIEAMNNVSQGSRELDISTTKETNSEHVMVAVRDTGHWRAPRGENRGYRVVAISLAQEQPQPLLPRLTTDNVTFEQVDGFGDEPAVQVTTTLTGEQGHGWRIYSTLDRSSPR